MGASRLRVTLHASGGNIYIRAYERRTSTWIDVAFDESDVQRSLASSRMMLRLWKIAIRSVRAMDALRVRIISARKAARLTKESRRVAAYVKCVPHQESVQLLVRKWRDHLVHLQLQYVEMMADLALLRAQQKEWPLMASEDETSTKLRPYLTMPQQEIDRIRSHFDAFDADGSGSIDAAEFRQMLFVSLDLALSKKETRAAMRKIDSDGSGEISFDEFLMWHALNDDFDSLVSDTSLSRRIVKSSLILEAKWRDGKDYVHALRKRAEARAAHDFAQAKQRWSVSTSCTT